MTSPENDSLSPTAAQDPLQELEDFRQRYEQLFTSLPAMLHSIDAAGRILSVSDLWLEKLGYSREEVLGRPSTDFLSEESRRYAREHVLPRFFQQGYCRDIHYRLLCKDGGMLDVLLSATAEYGPDGAIQRSLAVLNDITTLIEVEQSLRESEERLAHAFKGSRDGVWDWNAATGRVFYSTAWKQMLGYEEQDIGESLEEWTSRLHSEDRDKAFADIQAHLQGHSPYLETVYRLRCKDGSFKWILSRGVAVSRDENGEPLRIIGTHTDLSEYKRIEQELERSRSGLALAQSIAHIGSWEWDIETGAFSWSDEAFRMFGHEPGSFSPTLQSYLDQVHDDDRDMLLAAFRKAQEGGGDCSIEHRITLPDGRTRYVHCLGQLRRDEHGDVTGISGSVQDITERKLSEEALRESEERFRAMSNACLDALIMIDADDRIVFWSPAAERMFGHGPQEALGQKMHALIVPAKYHEDAANGLEHFRDTGMGPVIGSIQELPAIHKDGSVFPVERSVASFSSGGHWFAVGMLRDITQRKRDEERLTQLATLDSLTGLPNRRHFLELAEAALKHSQRYKEPLSLLMFDIDHFKRINDTFGHDAGDAVLAALAQVFTDVTRDADILGRMGGEEFAACLPKADSTEALAAAERLRAAVEQCSMADEAADFPTVTVSVGVATLQDGGSESDSLHSLLKRADKALYAAKHSGRNTVKAL